MERLLSFISFPIRALANCRELLIRDPEQRGGVWTTPCSSILLGRREGRSESGEEISFLGHVPKKGAAVMHQMMERRRDSITKYLTPVEQIIKEWKSGAGYKRRMERAVKEGVIFLLSVREGAVKRSPTVERPPLGYHRWVKI